jgi:hypothetical protein
MRNCISRAVVYLVIAKMVEKMISEQLVQIGMGFT